MNLLAINIPCWLIPILVGLISAILGYLLGRFLGGGNETSSNNDVDVDVYKNRISKLEADLAACKANKASSYSGGNSSSSAAASFAAGDATKSTTTIGSAKATSKEGVTAGASLSDTSSLSTVEGTAANFDADGAKAAFGKKIKQDDLTVVEGIGPKIQELFHNHDVKTWAGLAGCSVDKCQEVLSSGGKRFDIHKPGTWPEQSKMASLGQWQKLKDLQNSLKGGK